MNRRPLTAITLAVATTMLLTVAAVAAAEVVPDDRGSSDPGPLDLAPVSAPLPGDLVEADPVTDLTEAFTQRGVRGWTVTYWSSGAGGDLVEVTGVVLVPAGPAPGAGRTVMALAHGTTGIDPGCGPSVSAGRSAALGEALPYLDAGMVVTLTDYRGLGTGSDGPPHHYLDNRTAGLDVIDSVRAARHLVADTSGAWLASGYSQGGGAAWAANELADDYAPELDLRGTASAAGTIDVAGWSEQARRGELGTIEMTVLQYVLESQHRLDPSFDLDAYRSPRAAQLWTELSGGCEADTTARTAAAAQLRPGDIGPQDPAAAERLTALLTARAQPQRSLSAPLLVVIGGSDELIDAAWTRDAVVRVRAVSPTVEVDLEEQPGATHATLDVTNLRQWVIDHARTP